MNQGSEQSFLLHKGAHPSEELQEIHDLIKSVHNGGMGYRKLVQYLYKKGIKTARGNSWRNTQVSSVLKRYDEKMFRQQIAMTKY